MKKRCLTLPIIALLLLTGAPDAWSRRKPWPQPVGKLDRKQAIDQLFQGRALAPVEGIWASDDNMYEVAIVRNKSDEYKAGDYQGYDYLGLIVDTTNRDYNQGDLKCVLKTAASEDIFPGIWFMADKRENGTTFILSDDNTIKYTIQRPFGETEQSMLLRTYPRDGASPGMHRRAGSGASAGTGFFVATDLVVTAYHVIADCKDIKLVLADGTKVPATAAVCDQANDIALIRANRHIDQVAALPIGDACAVKEGGRVYTVGFPLPDDLGANAKVGEGIVNSVTGMGDDPRMYQISIPVQPGNSGGPLVDSHGCVIGIVTSELSIIHVLRNQGTLPQNVNFALKINYLDNMLAVLPGGAQVSRAVPGAELSVDEVLPRVRPAVVLVVAQQ